MNLNEKEHSLALAISAQVNALCMTPSEALRGLAAAQYICGNFLVRSGLSGDIGEALDAIAAITDETWAVEQAVNAQKAAPGVALVEALVKKTLAA